MMSILSFRCVTSSLSSIRRFIFPVLALKEMLKRIVSRKGYLTFATPVFLGLFVAVSLATSELSTAQLP